MPSPSQLTPLIAKISFFIAENYETCSQPEPADIKGSSDFYIRLAEIAIRGSHQYE
jgi:hypothetical protein